MSNKLATEEMTACPSCGDLTFNVGDCVNCLAAVKTKPEIKFDPAIHCECVDCGSIHFKREHQEAANA